MAFAPALRVLFHRRMQASGPWADNGNHRPPGYIFFGTSDARRSAYAKYPARAFLTVLGWPDGEVYRGAVASGRSFTLWL